MLPVSQSVPLFIRPVLPFSRFSVELTDDETAAATSSLFCSERTYSRGGSGGGLRSRGGSYYTEKNPKLKNLDVGEFALSVLHQVRRELVEFEP